MKRRDKGVTLIALVVTIVVLLILTGITSGIANEQKGIITQTKTTTQNAQKESIIQKIEAELYNEKVKSGEIPSKEKLKEIIQEKGYANSVSEDGFVTKEGGYTIQYTEIVGWK